jgi:hypothetical protein
MTDVLIEGLRDAIAYPVGTEVEVRRRFDQAWARGFTIVEQTAAGYHLRRQSDGAVLPVAFPCDDVRLRAS